MNPRAMKPKLIIVDDEPDNRRLFHRLVQRHFPEGEILSSGGGEDLLPLVRREQPDLIVLDAVMPAPNGFEICRRLKSEPDTARVMILMVSAQLIHPGDRALGLDSGADSYLCKPYEAEEMVAQIRALLRIRRHENHLFENQRRLEAELAARQRMEEDLEAARAAAESAARAKSDFLTHMSHEIRTPLNAILGLTELLGHTALNAEQRDLTATLRDSGEILQSIINSILDFSKIEAGRMDLERAPLDVREMVERSLSLVRADAAARGLDLRVRLAPDLPPRVIGDVVRLRQVLINLLGNAVKFTPRGWIELRAAARPAADNLCELEFTVEDTGIGIPPEALARLFQSFSQGDSSITRKYGGTGLGLAISRRLCELMQGRLWAESRPGRGSVFHARVRVGLPTEEAPVPAPAPPAEPAPDPASVAVLVAEDNVVNQQVAERMLRRLGHPVELVASGTAALDALRARPFPIVLLDIQMPDMDGVEAARRIRAEWNGARRPRLIALTAHALAGDRESFLRAGLDDYLSKPLRMKTLQAAIERQARLWANGAGET